MKAEFVHIKGLVDVRDLQELGTLGPGITNLKQPILA